jgi:hypothetical protein
VNIELQMAKQQAEESDRRARQFIEQARNAMRAVKICIQEGDDDEAISLIDEALGESTTAQGEGKP